MLKAHMLGDLGRADAVSCVAAATTAAGTWWSLIGEVAVQLLGVPLPVALAAATGAFLARTYQVAQPILRAIAGSVCWVVGACAMAPLAGPLFEKLAEKFIGIVIVLPASALAGAAFVIALAGPFALQYGIKRARQAVGMPPVPESPPTQAPVNSKETP